MTVTIYHNSRCSKSRETLALLEEKQIQPNVILYLEKPLSVLELQQLAQKLGIKSVREMMRIKDDLYYSLGLDQPEVSEQQLLESIAVNPALLERPIVVNGEKAKIGRPPESVFEIL
ncbi:arsenate reductase (glutaredoxin) [Pasteurella canis]|uniref:Arsenate reductase n=1 Tax=Pasteurella canis TaxID=753 RepID=A0ABQ4VDV1_9PAST|nr:arsenate reductase (glutaredoxin) [Pasteurella canis]UEA16889.1 arsenate reductase (glutaredoxin) [Pasteurella canis]UEC23327.1 arsenate reductase (glutaredoxin) [Pasteurella canis]GJH41848.1 putative arsenate reductase [Pasteurella canis]GJJ80162.1 putative arsenate reductase [Pasteurella canis]